MRHVLIFLTVALIVKDTSQLGDPFILRAIAQGLCLLVGGLWLLTNLSVGLLVRYWPIWGYITILLVSTYSASNPQFVLAQVASLVAVVLFFIAYHEKNIRLNKPRDLTLVNTTIVLYFGVTLISLVITPLFPNITYMSLFAGNAEGYESRFRGLFGMPAMMGAAAGLLVGMAWFGLQSWRLRVPAVVVGLLCLGLTLSRTFWLAMIIAGAATSWFYYTNTVKMKATITGLGLGILVLAIVANVEIRKESLTHVLRPQSISSLTGRTQLWEAGWKVLQDRPFIGYGYTSGAEALYKHESSIIDSQPKISSRELAATTLHNGYLQSLLDSGLAGTAFYVAIILLSIARFVRYDKDRMFAPEFYAIVFLAVANGGESVIYSASMFHGILFWALAVLAFSLRKSQAVYQRTAFKLTTEEHHRPELEKPSARAGSVVAKGRHINHGHFTYRKPYTTNP